MFGLEVTLLTGRYVAASEGDRERCEWPPHPGRLYSALVATWADADEPSDRERSALLWLESVGAPVIRASVVGSGQERTVVPHFVPVNDTSVIGLDETIRRSRKLSEIDASLVAEESAERPKAKLIEKLRGQRLAQLDVSSVVAAAGASGQQAAVELLPEHRSKQARYWPSVYPQHDTVTYFWPHANPDADAVQALDELAARLFRLGHSSTLVNARFVVSLDETDQRPEWIPDPEGSEVLRWVQPGQLVALERRFAEHQGSKPRSLPKTGVRYHAPKSNLDKPGVALEETVEWLAYAFTRADRRLPSTRTAEVARAVRGALLHFADGPSPQLLSGHGADGSTLKDQPHLSVLPIPFVGGAGSPPRHVSGQLVGVVIAIPKDAPEDERKASLRALGHWRDEGFALQLGRAGLLHLEPESTALRTLDPQGWVGPSHRWVTATPIALPYHPGDLRKGKPETLATRWERAAAIVADACEHSGLPTPRSVEVAFSPLLAGTEDSRAFPAFKQSDRNGQPRVRALLHARLEFDVPVQGPLVVGSGRFFGMGLLRPLGDQT